MYIQFIFRIHVRSRANAKCKQGKQIVGKG